MSKQTEQPVQPSDQTPADVATPKNAILTSQKRSEERRLNRFLQKNGIVLLEESQAR